MSTNIPNAGEFVIISQVRQSDNQNEPVGGQLSAAPTTMPKALVAFYRGEPEVLGTTQIFTGFLLISIGISLTVAGEYYRITIVTHSGISIWSAVLFIVSGSLSVAASVKPTVGKVISSLVMNIFCSLAAVCGIIIAAIDVGERMYYTLGRRGLYCAYYKRAIPCVGAFTPMTHWVIGPGSYTGALYYIVYTDALVYIGFYLTAFQGISSFFLLLFLLMLCIAISLSVFACKTVCRTSFQETTVVIYQTTSLNVSDLTRDLPPDATAALTSDLKTQT